MSIEKNLDSMNPKQLEAILQTQGPLLIMAGAGSGKTRVLTHRIAYLLEKEHVQPWNILAITFTNKAAREMKARIEQLVGNEASDMWVSTFHSMCVRILRKECAYLGFDKTFSICDTSEQQILMKRILKQLNIDSEKFDYRMILSQISQAKNDLLSPGELASRTTTFIDKIVSQCYQVYQEELKASMTMDFDDLIFHTVWLFQNYPNVLEYYQKKFHYIHVDEYQDTNHAQYQLVKLLANTHHNICVVGDADQSIYGWRGANIENILNFEKDYDDAKVIFLEQNYRSTQQILTAANQVISNNKNRKEKNLWTQNDAGEKVEYYRAQSEKDEARFVIDKIRAYHDKGYAYDSFAVLYRTNAQSRVMEENFLKANIPFKIVGGQRFFERMEIKDMLGYLRLLANPADDLSFRRVVNAPKRGVGEASIEKLAQTALLYGWTLLETCENLEFTTIRGKAATGLKTFVQQMEELKALVNEVSLEKLLEVILNKTGYLAELQRQATLEADSRIENLQELVSMVQQFDQSTIIEESEEQESLLVQFLTDVSLISDMEQEESGHEVTLMTLHAAKGLEFPIVFMIGMEEGIFPSLRSIMEQDDVEEERRLAYVGITRAEQKLFIVNAYSRLMYGRTQTNRPSRFIDEMDGDHLEECFAQEHFSFNPHISQKTFQGNVQFKSAIKSTTSSIVKTKGSSMMRNNSFEKSQSNEVWKVGDKVAHKMFGMGTIVKVTGKGEDLELDIAFPSKGIKRLLAVYAPITKV